MDDRSFDNHRFPDRIPAWGRGDGFGLYGICRRKEGIQNTGEIREWGDRGRLCRRDGEQCRDRGGAGAPVDAGDPLLCDGGDPDGCTDDVWITPRAAPFDGEAGFFLGCRNQYVYRQRHAPDPQPSHDRCVDQNTQGTLSGPHSDHPFVHIARRLHGRWKLCRSLDHVRIRHRGLPDAQI